MENGHGLLDGRGGVLHGTVGGVPHRHSQLVERLLRGDGVAVRADGALSDLGLFR